MKYLFILLIVYASMKWYQRCDRKYKYYAYQHYPSNVSDICERHDVNETDWPHTIYCNYKNNCRLKIYTQFEGNILHNRVPRRLLK